MCEMANEEQALKIWRLIKSGYLLAGLSCYYFSLLRRTLVPISPFSAGKACSFFWQMRRTTVINESAVNLRGWQNYYN